ncbi:uncharacterized protein LOC144329412 isoform X2 [Macaca mulatta]
MAKPTQPETRGHGGAGARSQQQQSHQEPVHQEGGECGQLPPPGYLIDSSNHPSSESRGSGKGPSETELPPWPSKTSCAALDEKTKAKTAEVSPRLQERPMIL